MLFRKKTESPSVKLSKHLRVEVLEARQLLAAEIDEAPVNRDAPVNDGIVNGSFESYTGEARWAITHDVEGWYGVNAQTVNREIGVDPDSLPSSDGIEIWRNIGKKTYAGQNQIELDGRGNVVDGVYQKFRDLDLSRFLGAVLFVQNRAIGEVALIKGRVFC